MSSFWLSKDDKVVCYKTNCINFPALAHYLSFKHAVASMLDKCDVMGQNQSHVGKHETAQICILSENVKICPFFVFNKNETFVSLCQLN